MTHTNRAPKKGPGPSGSSGPLFFIRTKPFFYFLKGAPGLFSFLKQEEHINNEFLCSPNEDFQESTGCPVKQMRPLGALHDLCNKVQPIESARFTQPIGIVFRPQKSSFGPRRPVSQRGAKKATPEALRWGSIKKHMV